LLPERQRQRVDLLEHLAQFLLLLLLIIPRQLQQQHQQHQQQQQVGQLPPRRAVSLEPKPVTVVADVASFQGFPSWLATIKAWAAPLRKAVHLQNPLPSVWHSPGVEHDINQNPPSIPC